MSLPHALRHKRRLEMALSTRGIVDIPLLGRYHYTCAQPALPEHSHRNAIEICYLETGRQSYRMSERVYRLRGGDLFIVPPNQRHSTGGKPEEKGVLYWMVIRLPSQGKGILGLAPALSQSILQTLTSLPSPHFRSTGLIKTHLDGLTELFHQPPHPLRVFAMLNRVRACLEEILRCADGIRPERAQKFRQSISEYIRDHLEEPLSIAVLAEQAGLSIPYFKTRFNRELGVPPREYVLRAKIAEAENLLQKGKNVTTVAFELGFSSSQYFATVFKRFTGSTPTAFRLQAMPRSLWG